MSPNLWLILGIVTAAAAEEPPNPAEQVFVVRPAEESVPALKLGLLPGRDEQIAGDAAVFYHRAIESLVGLRYREEIEALKAKTGVAQSEVDQKAYDWLSVPIDQLPRDEARKFVDLRSTPIEEARLGSLRETCDWGFRHRSEGFMLLLGDMQEIRGLSRWIALRARLHLADGKLDEAIADLRIGFALGRGVGQSDSYIQSLIAMAAARQSLAVLEEVAQAPGSPSLYWALAGLPRPFADLARPTESEAGMLEREFPMLRHLEGDAWPIATARKFADDLGAKLGRYVDGNWNAQSPLSRPAVGDLLAHGTNLLTTARDYRAAKDALAASGVPAAKLDAMPMIQVVGADSYRIYQERRDQVLKWTRTPLWQGARGWVEAERRVGSSLRGFNFVGLIPSARSAYAGQANFDRRVAVLQLFEALRLYAGSHDGVLPDDLDALATTAPAPIDPVTGRPFEYRRDGKEATVTGPAPLGFEQVRGHIINYRIRVGE